MIPLTGSQIYTGHSVETSVFSVTLPEINFGGCKCSKNALFAISGALKVWIWLNFSLQKMQKNHEKSKFRASKFAKMAVLGPLKSLKLVSRKI